MVVFLMLVGFFVLSGGSVVLKKKYHITGEEDTRRWRLKINMSLSLVFVGLV